MPNISVRQLCSGGGSLCFIRTFFYSFVISLLAGAVAGCGSGGGGTGDTGGGTPPPQASYSISLSAATVTLSDSGPQTITVIATPSNGFTGTITGSLSGLPTGVSVSPASFSIALSSSASATAQVQLSLSSSAVPGTSAITVSTTSGSLAQNTQFNLIVNVPGVSVVLKPATVSLTLGSSQTVQVSALGLGGFTGTLTATVTGLPSGVTATPSTFTIDTNTSDLVQFSASSSAASASVTVTITATNGTVSGSAALPLTVSTAGDFQITSGILNFAVSQSASVPFSVAANSVNGFNAPITVSFSNLPQGISIAPSTFTLQPGTSQPLKLAADFTAAPTTSGPEQFTITGTSGNITHSTNYSLSVYPTTDIGLRIQPSITLTVPAGTTSSIELFANPSLIQNALGTIAFTVGPIPAGITVSPASFNLPATGGVQQIYFSVDPKATPANDFVPISWTFGPIHSSATETIGITAVPQYPPEPITKAQLFVRTDTPAQFKYFQGPQFLVYHVASGRFFSTDKGMNRLNVIDGSTHTLKSVLTIPGAFALDQTQDGSVLYVGTVQGDLYVVDPVNLSIIRRYASSQISSYGFAANMVYALSNGQLMLYASASSTLAMWDPATNGIIYFPQPGQAFGNAPTGQFCPAGGTPVFLARERTRLIVTPPTYSGAAQTVCSFDPVADTFTVTPTIARGQYSNNSLSSFAQTPDGATVIVGNGSNVYVLDSATMTIKNSFPAAFTSVNGEYPSLLASSDNAKVFVPDANGADILDEYDLSSGQMVGWIPQPAVNSLNAFVPLATPQYQAMDANGVAAGVMYSGGVGFLDTTLIRPLPVGSHMSQMPLDVAFGPVGGGTPTSWSAAYSAPSESTLGSIYFGDIAGTEIGPADTGLGFDATSPAGTAGPVDVRVSTIDGAAQFIPEGFSYGPWVLEPVTGYATADGGGPASLFGYGFATQSPYYSGAAYVAPPADLQVLVGGSQAQVAGFNARPYFHYANGFQPLPANALLYTVPAGVAGTTATLTVANSSGTTSSSTFTYLPAVQSFAVNGQLVDGVYDSKRDVYYFTDSNQVRVFSATQKAWLLSIAIPAPQNAPAPQRLWALALSPDGSKLAITDAGAAAIYLLDPDTPSSVQSFSLASSLVNPSSYALHAVAVTNSGVIYFSDTTYPLNELDSSTGKVLTLLSLYSANDSFARFLMTPDGSTIYFSNSGLGMLNVATGAVTHSAGCVLDQALTDLVMDPAATRIFYAGCLLDSNLNTFGLQTLNLAENIDANYAYGGSFSSTGNLFFQPGPQSIDVFDGNTGAFLSRVSIPAPLSTNYRALVSNGKDSTVVAITGSGNGVAVIDLNPIPEPPTPSYLSGLPAPFHVRNNIESPGGPR